MKDTVMVTATGRDYNNPQMGPSDVRRFWENVQIAPGCWLWTRPTQFGYGRFWMHGTVWRAHRIAFFLCKGETPPGFVLDHLCRNRACVNPAHLEPVSPRTNILRGDAPPAKNTTKTECVRGHPLTPENLQRRPSTPASWRGECKQCATLHRRQTTIRRQKRRDLLRAYCSSQSSTELPHE